MKFFYKLFVITFFLAILFGCNSEKTDTLEEAAENGAEEKNEENSRKDGSKGLVELNLYEELDGGTVSPLLDVEYNHYPHMDVLTDDYITYFDENVAIAESQYYATAINWKTGEPIWELDGFLSLLSGSLTNVFDGQLYYKEDEDVFKTIGISVDPEDNIIEEINEEEYLQKMSRDQSETTSFLVNREENEEYVILEAYDKATNELLWDTLLPEVDGMVDLVEELENYVIFVGGRIPYFYMLDKETGEIVYEEDDYYTAGLEVEDTIYFIKKLTNTSYSFFKLSTDNWEVEELTKFEDVDHDYELGKYLEYTDGILTYHMNFGAIGIDTSTGEPYINYYFDSGELDGKADVFTFIADQKFYVLSNNYDQTVLSIIDIQTRELLQQYELEAELITMYSTVEVFKPLENNTFVIVTDQDGIYEFELSAFE